MTGLVLYDGPFDIGGVKSGCCHDQDQIRSHERLNK
jgi:hypothetical protein